MRPERTADFAAYARARIPNLLRFGVALTGSRTEADDLVQEALARVAVRWSRITRSGDPESYIRRTMVNLHISWWRSRRREILHADPPERPVVDETGSGEIWEALRSLPPRQRAVLVLRYFQDLTEAEAAVVLGCSVGTVKSQSAKALAKLRVHLNANTLVEKP